MATANVKDDLKKIAASLTPSASYEDAMHALYVRMKIAQGRHAADEGRVITHREVKRRFAK